MFYTFLNEDYKRIIPEGIYVNHIKNIAVLYPYGEIIYICTTIETSVIIPIKSKGVELYRCKYMQIVDRYNVSDEKINYVVDFNKSKNIILNAIINHNFPANDNFIQYLCEGNVLDIDNIYNVQIIEMCVNGKIKYKHTKKHIDNYLDLTHSHSTDILDKWLADVKNIKFSERALNGAVNRGFVNIIKWYFLLTKYGIPIKYSCHAFDHFIPSFVSDKKLAEIMELFVGNRLKIKHSPLFLDKLDLYNYTISKKYITENLTVYQKSS